MKIIYENNEPTAFADLSKKSYFKFCFTYNIPELEGIFQKISKTQYIKVGETCKYNNKYEMKRLVNYIEIDEEGEIK